MDIITRAEAQAQGLQRYYQGKPCKYGHDSERYTSTGICVACTRGRKTWNRKVDEPAFGPFISQLQAQAQGLRHYYNGDACKKGHVAAKYANGSGCVQCAIERAKGWKGGNREKVLAGAKVYSATKRNTAKELAVREADPQRRAISRIRSCLQQTLKSYGGRKAARSEELLGCTVYEARAWIAAKFQPGMSWENHGEWHIDHIRPCASFGDLTQLEQQKQCCHYTNLQPLWAVDNILKSDKWEPATMAA
jgi:hypothetical protein